jgi:hypothetical protein
MVEANSDGVLDGLVKNLPVLIVNGATLLIVVVILLRVIAKVIDRMGGDFTRAADRITAEIVSLRKDLRDVGQQTAVAVGALTERVSRIEGKIEGIALANNMSDEDRTPIGGIPRAPSQHDDNVYIDPDDVTPVQNPARKPRDRVYTPATGISKAGTIPTTYGPGKPPRKQ